MKAVMISIQPKWCELIASGKKTVEVRKTRPKLETPFKCYIYCTKGRGDCLWRWDGICYDTQFPNERPNRLDGKVIGEFVCDRICTSGWFCTPDHPLWKDGYNKNYCLTNRELYEYSKGGIFYEWHISDLVIYDKPRELSEFFLARHCFNYKNVDIVENVMGDYVTQYFNNPLCRRCIYYDNGLNWCEKIDGKKAITRPPQSWCYVEVQG